MKRSPMPRRKKPMDRSGALSRSQPVRRTETPEAPPAAGRRSPGARSGAMKRTGLAPIPADVVEAVRARSKGRCEAKATRACAGEGQHRHHRAGRGPGRDRVDLILDVCDPCHRHIHAHPEEAYEAGWMLSRVAPLPDPPDRYPGRLES